MELIEEQVQEFKNTFLPEGFEWRKGQKEAIVKVILAYIENPNGVVILDAPVGSGKSIIAMAISWILNQRNKKGYIILQPDVT